MTFDSLANGAIYVRNSGDGTWSSSPGMRWRVVEELRLGGREGTGPDLFGSVGAVVIDELGRIWVVDRLANEMRVFDVDGRFVRTVGRQGSGPGEFMRIGPAFNGPDGEIWVEDLNLRRWERFDTAGTRVGGLRSTSRFLNALRVWTRDGRFLVQDLHPTDANNAVFVVHRRSADSLVAEKTVAFPYLQEPALVTSQTGRTMPVPFTPLPWLEVSPEGDLWVSHRLGDYLIRRQTLEGDTLLVIERAHDPVSVPDSARERAIADLEPVLTSQGATFHADEVPRAYPPFESFHVSTDGTLWVRRNLTDGNTGFDVFENDGRYLGQPEVHADFASMRIKLITANHVYAVAADNLGVQSVVRLVIQRPGT